MGKSDLVEVFEAGLSHVLFENLAEIFFLETGRPILTKLRQRGLQYNLPVHIGENCWIGAGSIVTRDIQTESRSYGMDAEKLFDVTEEVVGVILTVYQEHLSELVRADLRNLSS